MSLRCAARARARVPFRSSTALDRGGHSCGSVGRPGSSAFRGFRRRAVLCELPQRQRKIGRLVRDVYLVPPASMTVTGPSTSEGPVVGGRDLDVDHEFLVSGADAAGVGSSPARGACGALLVTAASVREGAGSEDLEPFRCAIGMSRCMSVGPSSGGGSTAFGGRVADPALEFLELHRRKADEALAPPASA